MNILCRWKLCNFQALCYIESVMNRVVPNLKLWLFLAFLSILILILDLFQVLTLPRKLASYLTNPISFGIYDSSRKVGRQFYFIFAARFAAQENKALKKQVGQLLSENAQLRKKLAEEQALSQQEKHLDPKTYNLLPARPIGLSRYLKIDQGSSVGVKKGWVVVFNDNLVGRIVSVSEIASNVQLLADPDSKIAAFSQNLEGRSKGVLIGQFGSEGLMDKILHEEKISVGDLVYSEGTEGFLPRGLILGRVSEVYKRENEVFKSAKVQPVFDIRDLELVFVIQE